MEAVVEKAIEQLNTSSQRVRAVISILVVSTLLVFFTFWSTTIGDWQEHKVRVARDVLAWFAQTPSSIQSLSEKERRRYKKAESFYRAVTNVVQISNAGEWKTNVLQRLEKTHSDAHTHTTVVVPALGISFDVNDLGMFSGIAFFIILIMLRSCLSRQFSNLGLAFKIAEGKNSFVECFDLLSMGQVLSVPPERGKRPSIVWGNIHKLLFFLPLLVQLLIFYHDLRTRGIGLSINPLLAWVVLITSGFFLVANAALVLSCLHLSIKYDSLWAQKFRFLGELGGEVPALGSPRQITSPPCGQ